MGFLSCILTKIIVSGSTSQVFPCRVRVMGVGWFATKMAVLNNFDEAVHT